MGKSKVGLLLACLVILLALMHSVYAQTVPVPVIVTCDKPIYLPGDTVHITVKVTDWSKISNSSGEASFLIDSNTGKPVSGATGGRDSYSNGAVVGNLSFVLPNNLAPGRYQIVVGGALSTPSGGQTDVDFGSCGFWVIASTPTPETPSALLVLLPALLAEIYVLKRKKRN